MARRLPPAAPKPGSRTGRPSHTFEELAALRGKLKPAASNQKPAKPEPPPSAAANDARDATATGMRPDAAPDDDPALFRDAVRNVAPLTRGGGRAEIETPKPPPVPRPQPAESDTPSPAARLPADALEDAALFRLAVGDVTPLRDPGHAELGRARPSPYPLHARDEDRHRIEADPASLLLPPDPDALDPAELFRHAVRGSRQIESPDRVELQPPPPRPEPLKHSEDEQAALRESLDAPMSLEDRLEMGDEAVFLRPGLPRRVLVDLRRGRWVLQGEVDLHGYNRDDAREALARFLAASLQQGRRCVRVIHGKGLGSPGKLSILKHLSRGWLAQREEILAFCQAGPNEGGSGALLVLLRAGNPPKE
uniref:DNA mismatch repair protein MutS n=2 Tax=Aromatoleum anaerobium TaxID=182180 RepID=A0ABX1PKX8_9RHOO